MTNAEQMAYWKAESDKNKIAMQKLLLVARPTKAQMNQGIALVKYQKHVKEQYAIAKGSK